MKLLLGIDLETDSLDVESCRVLEIGAVLWDVDSNQPVTVQNYLIRQDEGYIIPESITELTGITQEMVTTDIAVGLFWVIEQIEVMWDRAVAVVAHNGTIFDKPILDRKIKDCGYSDWTESPRAPWIDTMIDPSYPAAMQSRKLSYLAADHGIAPTFAHRAVFDVLTMLQILSCYQIEPLIEKARSPMVQVRAAVTYDNRAQASARGYHWDADRRAWLKQIRACNLEQERAKAEFSVIQVD
jgi:DNA polymerase III alpha subunit (gram-positive type)